MSETEHLKDLVEKARAFIAAARLAYPKATDRRIADVCAVTVEVELDAARERVSDDA